MTKRAVCVGINDYPIPGADLKGCVNDARQWAGLLKDHYEFSGSDVVLLLDKAASKAAIIGALKDMVSGAKPGDVLVFTNSSHGTYVADTSGDEEGYDEAMCPWDIKDNLVIDDDLRELFSGLSHDVHLTVISDSCFSGSVTRAALADNIPGLSYPDHRRVRFLNPALLGRRKVGNPIAAGPRGKFAFPQAGTSHVLLSGCNDHEYAYDAEIGDTYHGAMTFHAIKAIMDSGFRLTYGELARRLQPMLDSAGYSQHPSLEGPSVLKRRQLFS